MKSKMGLPILAVVLGLSMIVGAIGVSVLSNVVNNDNTVGLPVVVELTSTSATPGGDLPDYVSGYVALNSVYDMKVSYTTTKALNTASIIVEFSKTGINTTDVLMSWTAGTWTAMTWTDNGNVLHGVLGITGSQPSGSSPSYFATLSYTVTGAFNFKVWVEGSL